MNISKHEISHERINILGVGVSAVTLSIASALIEQWIKAKTKVFVCVAPVSTIVDCQKSQDYRNLVNQAAMVTPDGMPVVWLGKWKGNKIYDALKLNTISNVAKSSRRYERRTEKRPLQYTFTNC